MNLRTVSTRLLLAASGLLLVAACGPRRLAVLGPLGEPDRVAGGVAEATRLIGAHRIDFRWELNEAGARVGGVGVARVEPPYRARLDLFLESGETVIAAALVDDDLRVPPGAPDDLLPPVELMWGTLGVFRPMVGTSLLGGDRLDGGARRLRYDFPSAREELHYELDDGGLRAVEVVEGGSVVEWVRVTGTQGGVFPTEVTYRNLIDFRELQIERTAVEVSGTFDARIWDPR